MNKRRLYIICWLTFLFSAVFADAVIMEFGGTPSQNKIVLRWKTGTENNLDLFIIERSTNKRDYTKIGELAPQGSNSSYEFVDDRLAEIKVIYYYRLRIRNQDGTFQFSESISVIPNLSSFAKTWGSIKALFQ